MLRTGGGCRALSYLCGRVQMGVTNAVVVDDEFVDTIGVGHAKLGFELTG